VSARICITFSASESLCALVATLCSSGLIFLPQCPLDKVLVDLLCKEALLYMFNEGLLAE
jgi:hypothetical protein